MMTMLHDHDRVPDGIRKALENYGKHGLRPGSCTEAILSGDLFLACAHADDDVIAVLPAIVGWIRTYLPNGSYGSPLIVEAWISARLAERRAAMAAVRAESKR